MNNCLPTKYEYTNEEVLTYLPGSKEREELDRELENMKNSFVEIPVIIGGKEIKTGNKLDCRIPHDKDKVIGEFHLAGKKEAEMAIEAALEAKKSWSTLPWQDRVLILLRAAELAAGPWRAKLNAATMLTQSKTYKQAEIDAACELIDFIRYNAAMLNEIYSEQPLSTKININRLEYRPLEGFIFAISPFNFTAIAGNLPSTPAIAGNTVVWKPASSSVYSNYVAYQLFKEAGLPDGVINFIPSNSKDISETVLKNENLSGIHFTGSTEVFEDLWKTVGNNIKNYKTFPRLVGETGGKNFVMVHNSADLNKLAKLLVEGAFEFQGQKCSAASRAYIPKSVWDEFKELMIKETEKITVGDTTDPETFMGAVIDSKSFNNIKEYIEYAKSSDKAEIIFGGNCNDDKGYFVDPTIILTTDPKFKTMQEEIFGPVLTIYIYDDSDEGYTETLKLVNETSKYALTGSIFARDRYAIVKAEEILLQAAGNFYVNDRPTGAVVGQQPFGGARKSGTNDKAGSKLNLMRWVSLRVIKETLL